MATKLDLARGYIDLGVKDGARELLDEVMRDGTREQRQAAVDLIKQIESQNGAGKPASCSDAHRARYRV